MSKAREQTVDKQSLSWTGSANINSGSATAANLAEIFTPGRPMNEPGVAKERLKVWLDVPEELLTVLKRKMKKIGFDCLKQNAEIVLDLLKT